MYNDPHGFCNDCMKASYSHMAVSAVQRKTLEQMKDSEYDKKELDDYVVLCRTVKTFWIAAQLHSLPLHVLSRGRDD